MSRLKDIDVMLLVDYYSGTMYEQNSVDIIGIARTLSELRNLVATSVQGGEHIYGSLHCVPLAYGKVAEGEYIPVKEILGGMDV